MSSPIVYRFFSRISHTWNVSAYKWPKRYSPLVDARTQHTHTLTPDNCHSRETVPMCCKTVLWCACRRRRLSLSNRTRPKGPMNRRNAAAAAASRGRCYAKSSSTLIFTPVLLLRLRRPTAGQSAQHARAWFSSGQGLVRASRAWLSSPFCAVV